MNSFYEHHKNSIQWHYRCFDRILLNGLIQPFQRPERVVGFFNTYRQLYPVTRKILRDIADQFQSWVKERAAKRNIPIVDAPKGRRDDFVDTYFDRAKPDAIVVILKAREPARIMTAIGDNLANRWHLQIADRWVVQYNFYINDRNWGRMFVRICPYLPFSARVCLNQHHWLANRMRENDIAFKQCGNALLECAAPERLQELADSLAPRDLVTCGQKWLAHLSPFFTAKEREEAGCRHRLFFSQVEFCDNLIFRRRAALAAVEIEGRRGMPWVGEAFLRSLRGLVGSYVRVGEASMWRMLTRIRVPSLVVWGDRDRLVDVALAPRVARSLTDSRLLVLNGVGHVAQLEDAVSTARAVLALLEDAKRGAGQDPELARLAVGS